MKGSVVRFISTTTFIVFGVLIVWWFKSVVTSEVFIVSERHKETFSIVNYAELGRKTFEEAAIIYSQTGVSKAGYSGGVVAEPANRKDGIAIWEDSPDDAEIADALEEYVVRELKGSLAGMTMPGKHTTVSYEDPTITAEADTTDFSKSEKIFIKAGSGVKVSKNLKTQAMSMTTETEAAVGSEMKSKYFALYDAAKRFFDGGRPEANINSALGTINTVGTKTNEAPKCAATAAWCDTADKSSRTCPSSFAIEPTDAEVLAETGYSVLTSSPFSVTIADEPFASFRAKFAGYGFPTTKAGYNDPADKSVTAGSCTFTCNYQWENPCKATVKENCVPADDPDDEPVCEEKCVPGIDTTAQSCPAETKTSRISFTFLVDMYSKYSSEDPAHLVPSQKTNTIDGVFGGTTISRQLPLETLKFNFLTHSCSMVSGGVATTLKDDTEPCSFPPDLKQV